MCPWPGIQGTFTEKLEVHDFPIGKRFNLAEFQEEFQEELLNKLQEAHFLYIFQRFSFAFHYPIPRSSVLLFYHPLSL